VRLDKTGERDQPLEAEVRELLRASFGGRYVLTPVPSPFRADEAYSLLG
jgi:hypothetical protein